MSLYVYNLPKSQFDAGEDRTNSMHWPHFLSSSSYTITGKHSGCVIFPIEPQHDIVLPLWPINSTIVLLDAQVQLYVFDVKYHDECISIIRAYVYIQKQFFPLIDRLFLKRRWLRSIIKCT